MNKKEFQLLEKVFQAEYESGFNNGIHLFQTESKLAEKMQLDGLIWKRTITYGDKPPFVKITGYELTQAGRYHYCSRCDD